MTGVTLLLMSRPRVANPELAQASAALRKRIRDVGHNQTTFASEVGRTQSWVSSQLLIRPDQALGHLAFKAPDIYNRLLRALEWTTAQLNEATGLNLPQPADAERFPEHQPDGQYVEVPLTRPVPVYPAGTGPAWDLEEVLETLMMPADLYRGKDLLGLRAMSASMEPYLPEGAIAVIVHDDGMVEPGDFCGIRMADDGVVVKRFVRELEGGLLLLESLNPSPDEERLFTAPLGSRVIGKVVRRVLQD